MRMIGKAGDGVIRLIAAKGVEQQEGIQPALEGWRQDPG